MLAACITIVRQRRRMEERLAALSDAQWKSPSRCAGWCAQDVVAHLIGTNQFWHASVVAGLGGAPTRVLGGFDPAASPEQMVAPMRAVAPADTLEQFAATNQQIFDVLDPLDDAGWSTLAESPPGHVPIRLLAHHALWDAWVHERDIFLPLALAGIEEPDEVISCLRYAAALGPVFAVTADPDRRGALVIDATDPDVRIVVEVDTTVEVHTCPAPTDATWLRGSAVGLVEMLSIRAPLDQQVAEQSRWMLAGLAEVFDTEIQIV